MCKPYFLRDKSGTSDIKNSTRDTYIDPTLPNSPPWCRLGEGVDISTPDSQNENDLDDQRGEDGYNSAILT